MWIFVQDTFQFLLMQYSRVETNELSDIRIQNGSSNLFGGKGRENDLLGTNLRHIIGCFDQQLLKLI